MMFAFIHKRRSFYRVHLSATVGRPKPFKWNSPYENWMIGGHQQRDEKDLSASQLMRDKIFFQLLPREQNPILPVTEA